MPDRPVLGDVLGRELSCSGRVSDGIPELCVNPAVPAWLHDHCLLLPSVIAEQNLNSRKIKT